MSDDAQGKLYSYVVTHDGGFAPNPFFGYCTLANCKPKIRRGAQIGDWVVGTGTTRNNQEPRVVYAMRVTEVLTFEEYWADARFVEKKPRFDADKKFECGDNIYYRDPPNELWCQLRSQHSNVDGSVNLKNLEHDTSVNRILISKDFVYWGGNGPVLPIEFDNDDIRIRKVGPGHKCRFPESVVSGFISWIRSHKKSGFIGKPQDWNRAC